MVTDRKEQNQHTGWSEGNCHFVICVWGRVELTAAAPQKQGSRLWSQVPICTPPVAIINYLVLCH